ncbi:MAG TPA: hypothetical protein VK447_13185 [Myxococcaceae bacterium]|nr:hypothetical protein [Myxococcaceae bacterium]
MNRSSTLLLSVLLASTPVLADKPSPKKEAAAAPAAQPIPVPGTRVSLVPPEGFVPSTSFAGFQRDEWSASVIATELPAPYEVLLEGFTKEGLATRGMKLLSKKPVKAGDRDATLFHIEQQSGGATFRKWLVLVGDEKSSTLVTATFLKEREKTDSAPLKASVLSTVLGAASAPQVELTYTLEKTPGLQKAHQLQNALIFTPDGKMGSSDPEGVVLIVAPSLGNPGVIDARSFSEKRIVETRGAQDVKVESRAEIEIDGMKGWELVATGKDKNGVEIFLHQVLVLAEDGYYMVVARASASQREAWLPKFKETARSLKRKK